MKLRPQQPSSALYALGSLYPHVTGGMEIFNYYFLNRMLSDRHDVIYYLGYQKADQEGGHFVPLKKRWPARLFYPFQFFFSVYRLRKRVDYAYLSYSEQSWIISFAQSLTLRFFKIPYFVTIHWGKEPGWKFRYPYVYYFRHAHAVIGVSEPICAAFKKAVPACNFLYVPPLIPFQQALKTKAALRQELGFDQEDRILLFAGSLKPMKNPDKIVEAFRELGPAWLEKHRVKLVFAGRGGMEGRLKSQIEAYGLGKYIRLAGLVSREDMPGYYGIADFYIISSDYEGTSLSLLEAMFNKLPVVASDAPGINRMLAHEQNALLYETTNTAHLAQTLERIFSDHVLAERLAERGFADYQEQYSYEFMIEKYKEIFSGI